MCGSLQGGARADLTLAELGAPYVVDFSSFAGLGFSPVPSPGQLASTTWRVGGFTDGTLNFGDTGVTGDFARGQSSGGVTAGGVYAFEVADGDWALGVQATATDFNPGFIELRVRNRTGSLLEGVTLGYDLYCRNDQPRSSAWNVSWSNDGQGFVGLPSLGFQSPAQASSNSFDLAHFSASIPAVLADEGELFLRWTSLDYAGGGSRDEFALDNVTVNTTATPEPSTMVLLSTASLLALATRYVRRHRARGRGGVAAGS